MSKSIKHSSQVMYLKDLISAPLVATIEADAISTNKYLDYLYAFAFKSYNKETREVGELQTLTFEYTTGDVSGRHKQKISIPLITLVPLPLLQIHEADFDFDINIIDFIKQDSNSNEDPQKEVLPVNERSKLRVALSPVRESERKESISLRRGLSASMKVSVKMRQADMPGGVSNLLNITTNNLVVEEVVETE